MGHSTPAVRAISEIGAHQHYFPRSLMFVLNMCRYKLNSEKKKKIPVHGFAPETGLDSPIGSDRELGA